MLLADAIICAAGKVLVLLMNPRSNYNAASFVWDKSICLWEELLWHWVGLSHAHGWLYSADDNQYSQWQQTNSLEAKIANG
jgi:hypothetical protein